MLLTLLACADPTAGEHGVTFVLAPADLGAPVAASTGFDPADGDTVGMALDQALPVFGEEEPAWNVPMTLWELASRSTVADPGTCPFDRVEGDETIHEGGCRSTSGYEFEGEVRERTWTEEEVTRTRFEADLTVTGDADGVVFDSLVLRGVVERAEPADASVDAHLDVNLALSLIGYWEQRDPDEPRATAWADWAVSGAIESAGETTVADAALEIGGGGGLYVAASGLLAKDTCPIEAVGTAELGEGIDATLEGVDGCDACATISFEGGTSSACDPDR